MKVIFLDVDGVLNYSKCWERPEHKNNGTFVWDKDCISQLNRIIKETGAKIVVSSTWRNSKEHYNAVLNEMNIEGEFIGKTPKYVPVDHPDGSQRGDEIQAWMDSQEIEPIEKFVILDDDADMRHLIDHLIQSDFMKEGLTKELADEAIQMLNS